MLIADCCNILYCNFYIGNTNNLTGHCVLYCKRSCISLIVEVLHICLCVCALRDRRRSPSLHQANPNVRVCDSRFITVQCTVCMHSRLFSVLTVVCTEVHTAVRFTHLACRPEGEAGGRLQTVMVARVCIYTRTCMHPGMVRYTRYKYTCTTCTAVQVYSTTVLIQIQRSHPRTSPQHKYKRPLRAFYG